MLLTANGQFQSEKRTTNIVMVDDMKTLKSLANTAKKLEEAALAAASKSGSVLESRCVHRNLAILRKVYSTSFYLLKSASRQINKWCHNYPGKAPRASSWRHSPRVGCDDQSVQRKADEPRGRFTGRHHDDVCHEQLWKWTELFNEYSIYLRQARAA